MDKLGLRTIVRGAYDVQKLRIQMGNRIVGNFKAKLGQEPGKPEEEMDPDSKAILKRLRERFYKITDGVKTFPRQATFKGDEVISSYTELCLLAQYVDLEKHEAQHFRRLGNILKEYPIWNGFLESVKGIGPAMGGVIISEIDIHKARYASSIWRYAGLDVAADGRGRSRRKEHLEVVEYENKDGEKAKRDSITFNPFLKTKLMGVLAASFLKCGETSPYAAVYYERKARLEQHAVYGIANDEARIAEYKEKSGGKKYAPKGHRHNMALRFMVKMFLIDLYKAWRELEGLEVFPPYHEAKLGLKHDDDNGVAVAV